MEHRCGEELLKPGVLRDGSVARDLDQVGEELDDQYEGG